MSVRHSISDEEEDDFAIPLEDPLHRSDNDYIDRYSAEESGLMHSTTNKPYTYARPKPGWQGVVQKLSCRARQHASRLSNGRKRPFMTRCCLRTGYVLAAFILCLGVLQLVSILQGAYVALFPGHKNRVITDWDQIGKSGEGLKHYPTDFTRDILTISCHSHNDYWRDVPLYSGISAGCISTEADVWLHGSDLLVGHDESSLTANRTLRSLYVDPLIEILDRQNPTTDYVDGSKTMNGVFDTDRDQVFTLLIDLKTKGNETFDAVIQALSPLREKRYLTYVDNDNKVVNRPLRVIATGETQFDYILSDEQNPHNDIFFDAPIEEMSSSSSDSRSSSSPTSFSYSPTNSYYASGSFTDTIGYMLGWSLSSSQLAKLRAQIQGAHDRGLKVRYWETPAWPVSRRNRLWEILVEEGADVLNVDDLKGAVEEDWRRRKGWL